MAIFEKSKVVKATRCLLKVVSDKNTFVINGQIVPVGAIVEVSMREAHDLQARGEAIDATSEEVTAAGASVIVAAAHAETWSDAA